MASIVVVFAGGRGSGKTLSMSVQALMDMVIHNKTVWANYPVHCDVDTGNSVIKHFKSESVEIDDLVSMRPDICDGIICLDELNLWANNRGAMSICNRMLNAWMQLIRKRRLSIYITVQAFESLDRMIRWQTDITCLCHDMHFVIRQLPEGAYIKQKVCDWSGIFTGNPISSYRYDNNYIYQRERNTRKRYMRGRRFWGIYDSWNEFDIINAMKKFQIEREVKTIGKDEAGNPFVASTGANGDLSMIIDAMREQKGVVFERQEVIDIARNCGISGSDRYLIQVLKNNGFVEADGGFRLE